MRKRNIRIWARVSEQENEIIKNRIKKTGLSREAYIRCLLLGTIPREKPDDRFYDVMRDLHGICNNANQLARKAATLGFIDAPFYKREAEKWSQFQLEVRQAVLLPDNVVWQ